MASDLDMVIGWLFNSIKFGRKLRSNFIAYGRHVRSIKVVLNLAQKLNQSHTFAPLERRTLFKIKPIPSSK